jgi:tripartite-type tricarboxylate transporter receptor subunit TctC
VPFAAGGSTDIVARLIGQRLAARLGQPFIIENRPGAGSNVGTEVVVRAAPDGHTLLMVGAPNAINATLYEKLPFNFISDIAPIAGIISIPNVMIVNPSLPLRAACPVYRARRDRLCDGRLLDLPLTRGRMGRYHHPAWAPHADGAGWAG